jgi:uncharacterized protein (DUF433 family)
MATDWAAFEDAEKVEGRRGGAYTLKGTRILPEEILDNLVDQTPEEIAEQFPPLTPERIKRVAAFARQGAHAPHPA